MVDRNAIRRFVLRDRDAVDALRRAHWAERYRHEGPAGSWRVAQALRAHMRVVQPAWPTEADRENDLRHHIELKRKLDRTAHALSHR